MKRKGVPYLYEKKAKGEKMPRTALYDYPMACIAEEAGIDIINVGDSISMITFGNEDTLGAKLDIMIEHAIAVRKGAPTAFIMGDMPFGSYQVSEEEAVRNAIRYLKEAGTDSVKIEGGAEIVPLIRRLTEASIPVVAHTGLTPQSINLLGGYKTQGRDAEAAYQLIKNVIEFEKAGAVAVVVESVPQEVARIIYEKLSIPFLGTGAGPYSDSPMINLYDLLGFFERTPRFAKRYANLKEIAVEATNTFVSEVRKQIYPGPEHCYNMHEGEYDKLVSLCKDL
ncbi:MAG: 3-methyl-2-oxobutanoate hydroxymethyltransferase [Acetomicrobium sp.]|jgi:3-methyl-2-oxobutanoate hydroxymethyltransferase|uniref:3-methyl-2-oxobutanoate hydroxymethyltransferase n=1 Tax=Acetomicrobium sp. TaxID=1872099 RepID=UPI002B25FD41|nr:3-methyl-2-oxobutanoate hydroxymethyltransferase [Acetomicrobium sp.]